VRSNEYGQQRFSEHFALGKSQPELDFVDIPLDTDINLCVDPYALSIIDDDPWFVECNNLVVDFFQLVVNSIRGGFSDVARDLLSNLREPNETRLGLSQGRPSGRGIGRLQAGQLYDRLVTSRAVRTGKLRDLYDCELIIPGIGGDKISDVTTNVIRGKLITYTQAQCRLHRIPIQPRPCRPQWNDQAHCWKGGYQELPVYQGVGIILVPKAAVRLRPAVDHRDYYRHYVLPELQREYLLAEHPDAATGLVKVLRNGKRLPPTKKALEQRHPCSKEYLFEFSEEHPSVLESYKASLPKKADLIGDADIEGVHPLPREIDIRSLSPRLDAISPGRADAPAYHRLIVGILQAIFHPDLRNPLKEAEIHNGRKRIDIRFTSADTGFFRRLRASYGVMCPHVFFECKNYASDPSNPELDQLAGRFSEVRGRFGILVCRIISDRDTMVRRCKDIMNDRRGFVLVLDDNDIKRLLDMRARNDLPGISDFLDNRFSELIM